MSDEAPSGEDDEHTKGARESTRGKHEKGRSRRAKDKGGERADTYRRFHRKKPYGFKGKWPPKKGPKKAR